MPTLRTTVELQFGGRLGRPPQGVHVAFGRALLLGEHRPPRGGHLLAAPLDEGVACAWGMRPDSRVVVWGMNARQKDSFHLTGVFRSGRGWADLARGAYAHVAAGARRMPGLDLMVQGDLPMGAGLASSAAYVVVLLRSIYEAVGIYRSRWELAEDVPAIERAWIGREDDGPTAYTVAALRPGRVLCVDCSAPDHEAWPLPAGCRVRTEPVGSQAPAAEVEPSARHVGEEVERVARGAAALEAGDAETLGALMDASHASRLRDLPGWADDVAERVATLRSAPGVLGARLQAGGRLVLLERPDPGHGA